MTQLQPYLCIGGTEIAHPTRTLTYLANLGHGYMTRAPDPSCGACFGGAPIIVPPPPPGLAITNPSIVNGIVGQAYSQQMVAANADGPTTWTVTGLPPGLSINPTTGLVGGTPTTIGTYSPTFTVADLVAPTAQRTYTMQVTEIVIPPTGNCAVPYAVTAGFERSVTGKMGTMIWEMYRGAAPVTKVGVHRETVSTGTTNRPAIVPTTGWVSSDYAASFTLPLLLNEDTAGDCVPAKARFERWYIYDTELWPVPHTSPPAPGEASGYITLLFFIAPCAIGAGFGQCTVSFDNGVTWANVTTTTVPGRASGAVMMPLICAPTTAIQLRLTNPFDATQFAHRFQYLSGGSTHFDVEVWTAPVGAYMETPPPLPFSPGEVTPWSLTSIGNITAGVETVNFEDSLISLWGSSIGGYYKWWRYTDRVSRASFDLVLALQGPNVPSSITSWAGVVAFSIDGGVTWNTPPKGGAGLTVTPPLRVNRVPTVPYNPAPAAAEAGAGGFGGGSDAGDWDVTPGIEAAEEIFFQDPVTDLAPWYDPAIPESADVLGVWIEEFQAPVPYKRDVKDKRWGGTLSPARMPSRELLLTGYVYTKSCEATEYAKRWLFEALAQDSCNDCDLPDAVVFRGCDPETQSSQYARTIRRVGLIDYDPEIEPEFPCCLGFKFEATLRAEVPYMYRDPVLAYDGPIVNMAQEPVCNICAPCPTITAMPACGCMQTVDAHVDQRSLNECYCSPARARRVCVPIDPPGHLWNDAALRLTLTAGPAINHVDADGNHIQSADGLRNLRIVAYPNPMGLTSGDINGADFFACQEPCVSVEVACLPATAQLVVDGTSRRSKVMMGPSEQNGYGYLSSGGGGRFTWPDIGCNGLMLCIETDSVWIEDGGTLKVEVIPRERA